MKRINKSYYLATWMKHKENIEAKNPDTKFAYNNMIPFM